MLSVRVQIQRDASLGPGGGGALAVVTMQWMEDRIRQYNQSDYGVLLSLLPEGTFVLCAQHVATDGIPDLCSNR